GGQERLTGNILIQGIAFLSPNSPSPSLINGSGIFDRQRSGLATYEVQSGDTPSYIAASFGISTNTLLWANDLSYWSIIKPGQKLVILPASGVLHEVTRGETLASIVSKYKGDFKKTVAYNGLPANGSIRSGQEIVIPEGKKPIAYQPKTQYTYQSSKYIGPYGNKSRRFPWGQCTWYVAQKRLVTWSGHAKYWLGNAKAQGLPVCYGKSCEPKLGAIIATSESWYGHVAYIEAVNGNYITISEMHGIPYWNRGKIKTRVLNESDWRIRGYIY
ncbi:LysM peptidoglycan-binding domain-containing protein, partial [bacterium]|nr:LysM peptidoglycan-binding domain-containing protein [bacterium]